MKLLFDENLSYRLVEVVRERFPESAHVSSLGLLHATDARIWEFARQHGYTIVSKDSDFAELSAVRGDPPKVVWLTVGNASTGQVAQLIARQIGGLASFEAAEDSPLLILSFPPDGWLPGDLRNRN